MNQLEGIPRSKQNKALGMSTLAFAVCFAVWTIFSIIGLRLRDELGINDTQFGLMVGTPILTGSISRIFLGIWTDQFGGRIVFFLVMIFAALATYLLTFADTYAMVLLAGLGVGLAGGSFAVGVTYVSKWYPKSRQGTALGVFGVGNVGAAVTSFVAPFVMVAFGWQVVAQIWAAALAGMALIFWFATEDDPELKERKLESQKSMGFLDRLTPLRKLQVWRFSIYYFFAFGGSVAMALWLPRYLIEVYGLGIETAGMLTVFFALPASLFRAYGGHLSDKYGARTVMYLTFGVSMVCTFMLSYPETDYVIHGIDGPIAFSTSTGLVPFCMLIFVFGFFMSLGMAAVFKHIPVYYEGNVGVVGGTVGMIGGLGGFILPIAFGVMNDLTGIWTSCFMLMFALVTVALLWMHFAILRMERAALPETMRGLPELPEMVEIHEPEKHGHTLSATLDDWRPDDPGFWESTGRRIAHRNLWISIPCLLLAFSVWMVWSVVVAMLPSIGFDYTIDELFWLVALPGLSGATLRMFYAFVVPIVGGRRWTTLTTASLLIPAFGIGYAVQDPETPYVLFLILALLCGLGGGNFTSSMANISFFFPRGGKGKTLALNSAFGNAGVGIMQFLVPVGISLAVFGAIGGEPQTATDGSEVWLQNAGFIWVPFLVVATISAWFGMNDIATAEVSFEDQAVILSSKHSWIICWLRAGHFGSFIGYSAAFPLLSQLEFPEAGTLKYAFLGPLVGALSRATTGWISDKFGGGRATLWTFAVMVVAVGGVLYFLGIKDQPGAYWGFFSMFVLLFFCTGVGSASTFQMIPVILEQDMLRSMPELGAAERSRRLSHEAVAIIGFSSAVAAYGAYFIPKAYGTSIALTGAPQAALWIFLMFYVTCIAITWYFYTRRGGLLHDVERGLHSQER